MKNCHFHKIEFRGEYLLNHAEYDGNGRLVIPYKTVENAPTAFDKEKVIYELRSEASRWNESGVEFKDEKEKGVATGFRLSTHIVDRGGVK